MVKVKLGNILNCTEDIIVHQVNVQGVMRRWGCKTTRRPISRTRKRIFKILRVT